VVSVPVARGVPVGMLAVGYVLVLLHTVPLAARRRFPGTVLALSVASGLAFAALFLPPFFLGPAILVAVYSVAAYGDRWVSLAGLVVAELGLAAVWFTPAMLERSTFLLFMGFIAVAWVLGHFVGDRHPSPTRQRSGQEADPAGGRRRSRLPLSSPACRVRPARS
jgi:hypothetical protein